VEQVGPAGTDTISLTGITAVGRHGVFDHERRDGQPFGVDLVLHLDLRPAGAGDDLDLTVNYASVAACVEDIITGEPLNLIEALAEKIAGELLARFPADAVQVTVHKPKAPVQVSFEDIAVSVFRDRR
jgi:dihydroneopterin aldolase